MSPKLIRFIQWFLAVICILFLFSGCALWNDLFGEEELTPAELMSEGMEDFNEGKFESATEIFQKIKDRYPYSRFSVKAELKMADALYERGLFDEAFDEYTEFEKLHPKNPSIPYVLFQKGMCHFSRVKAIDRTQSFTHKAKEEFERLIKRYRRSLFAERARRKVRECYIRLAEHELMWAIFTLKWRNISRPCRGTSILSNTIPTWGNIMRPLKRSRYARKNSLDRKRKKGRHGGDALRVLFSIRA